MAAHNDLGRKGEEIAKDYLGSKGYKVICRNWRRSQAEVDLIAEFGQRFIFIEVKTRTGTFFGEPETFVGAAKQRNMQFAAEKFIEIRDHQGEIRFDIISILFGSYGSYNLRHIEDAFWPGF
ncbi:YraN family protein [Hufsiella ginkgonis]|uniref:UPF0102 protein GS398_04070 n=1 Tax=Hufsiella ginkgonis TaxID=2695274 RepID=A0A7K1XTW3_9SPHI|nr:YraN family protein [Hufsiella ginkgonis]MXV14463.1 endonuclease [Hufsiella ginkgonis]